MKTNDVMTATIRDKVTTLSLVMVLLLTPTGTAWAMKMYHKDNYKDTGATWDYSLPNTRESAGAIEWSNYYNPVRQHCTRIKLNGSWRDSHWADAKRNAHDQGRVERTGTGLNSATAGIKTICPTLLTVQSEPDQQETSSTLVTDSSLQKHGNES